jgi:hypothetical protein
VTRFAAAIEILVGFGIGILLNSRVIVIITIAMVVCTILVPRMIVLRRYGPDPESFVVRAIRSRLPAGDDDSRS